MAQSSGPRVLIIVFDALRPDFLTPDLMPNLCAFAGSGVRYTDSHATFPTETRVNQSAVTTGCMPARHGIVGNKFAAAELGPGRVLNTGDDVALEAALPALANGLLGVPALADILRANGLSYASLSTGTSGGGRLINLAASANGSFRVAMRRPEASEPPGAYETIANAIGPIPPYALPATDWVSWGVRAYLDVIEAKVRPDVMLLWLCEPDETFHRFGIGSPASLETIAHADAEFGRILEHHATALAAGTMQIIAMSDHGQTTLTGAPLDLPRLFTAAGFRATDGDDEAICSVVVDNAGGVWLRPGCSAALPEMVCWLREQTWCGPLFTRDGTAQTLRQSEIGLDHARAPDVSVVLRASDAVNAFGLAGATVHNARYPVGGGCHGGLSRPELHNVLTLGGTAFRSGAVINMPAGNVDILPTVLALLGLAAPVPLDGRVLAEAFAGASGQQQAGFTRTRHVSPNTSGARTVLETVTVDATRYLHAAHAE